MKKFFYTLSVLVCLLGVSTNAWAASAYMSTKSADPAQGLVYVSTSNAAPDITAYQEYSPGGCVDMKGVSNPPDEAPQNECYIKPGSGGGPHNSYMWAQGARGYEWKQWASGYQTKTANGKTNINTATERAAWNGSQDLVKNSAGNGQCTYSKVIAEFKPATSYTITYAVPAGGSYHVGYSYLKTRERSTATFYDAAGNANSYKDYEFYTDNSEQYDLTPSTEEPYVVTSYAADKIILSVPAETTNFLGWCEDGVLITGPEDKTYQYEVGANVTISPLFKEIGWGEVTGDLTVNVGTGSEAELDTYSGKKVYVACPTLIGPWSESDFTITTSAVSNDKGSIALDLENIKLDKTNYQLEFPYSYTATHWGGIAVDVTITPTYGEAKQFTIACSAEEVVGYEACIEESGIRTHTGTLADMITQANVMDNKPTVKLMNNGVTITTPVSFTKSMTFDVNGKVLTANCTSAFSIDAVGIDVQIIDGSFTQVGEIHTSYASANPVSVVTFTQAAKLTMNGGTLSVANTGTGAAYGLDVQQGSIFYMTGGDLTVTANTGNAQGAHVASASDYATLNGGSIAVSAPTNAYGLWSAGQSNITDATVAVETTTGLNAYGVYVNGGISTITTTEFAVNAKTTNAYGAYVNAGRLNFNGGKLAVEAVSSNVYGVLIAAGATAMMQQGAKVTTEATGASGTQVFGIYNLGTVSLNNLTVTATSPTNYATAVNSMTSAVSTTIEDGTYTANTETGYAYGLHHQYGALNVDGGTFKGIVKTSGDHAYGAHAEVNATIANATILGETRGTATTAYGFVGSTAGKAITLTNCAITAKSNTSIASAIYTKANLTATDCMLTATTLGTEEAYGVRAKSGTSVITNCDATVTANSIKAYGAYQEAGSLTINGGTYNVEAKQATATAAENSNLYGLNNVAGAAATVTNASFIVTASNAAYSQTVYGAYIKGTLNSTGATYSAVAKTKVRGMYSNSTLTLSNNTISARATNGTNSYGIYADKNFTIDGDIVSAQATTTDVYALYFGANAVGEVRGGKFKAAGNGTNTYGPLNATASASNVKLKGGVYDTNTNLSKYKATDYNIYNLDDTHADYADGYYYTIATENPSPYVCKIVNGAHYTTLEAAMQYAKDHAEKNCTIVMTQDYTLPAGDYELPANATLLIPHVVGQNEIYGVGTDDRNKTHIANEVVEFMRLTLADNAKLNVSGTIEVSAQMYALETGHISYINGPYSRIFMNSGSLIQLNSGAVLYAWGKVTGSGEIKVKNNAEVREMFQIYGMPSMSNIINYYNGNSYKFFPVQQYEISNIEVPTTYYFNSRLMCAMTNFYQGFNKDDNIRLVGTQNALFLVDDDDESSWVRKSYSNSYQVWEVNSSAKLGSLTIVISGQTMNSLDYILPITTNMKIHILDGNFVVTQSAQLLPGSQIEVNKTGTLTINEQDSKSHDISLYVFDADQSTFTSKPDALLNVHGKIDVKGGFYTSNKGETTKTDGANIYSNNADAGTILFNKAASAYNTSITLMTSATATKEVIMEPAKLKNGTGAENAYTLTAGTAVGQSFAYLENEWQNTYTNGCFQVKNGTVYAKPSEYVALKKSQEDPNDNTKLIGVEETNHTYLTSADKILILMDECQWWEVETTSDPTVFECKKSGYEGFYYYDESASKWKLKTVNVTFYMKEEGTDTKDKVIVTDYNGIPDQSVIASNPEKGTTDAATYQFYGWKSSVSGTTYHWTATLESATADMSYRPVFTENPRHYTVTFKAANNGADVPVEYAYGETPSYTPVKDADAQYTYYFQYWLADDDVTQYAKDATLPTVTGKTSYTAVWSQTVNKYSVIWKNGDEVLETDTKQAYGTSVSYDGATPTKEEDANFAYTHDGWSLTDGGAKLSSLPTVNGEMTFYAHYSTTPRYKVTFANYDGTPLQQEQVTQGVNPVYSGLTPGRARDLDGFYLFTGWRNGAGTYFDKNATLPVVTGKETFTAQYDYVNELYLITLNNVDGAGASWSGKFGVGAIPYYNRDNNDVAVMPTKASTAQYEYTFSGWDPEMVPVAGEATYTALFEQTTRKYNITFANLDGNGAQQTIEVEYGQTPECPVTPTKVVNHRTYEFLGWNTTIVPVTGNATYTAQFSSTGVAEKFLITFDLDDGSDPVEYEVDYGEIPVYTGATPTKEADDVNTYTFSGWNDGTNTYSSTLPAVTGPADYIAVYKPTIKTFTITFKDFDGTTLKTAVLAYGATPTCSDPVRPNDEVNRKKYTFTDWSPAIATVTANATYTATYSEMTYVASVTTPSDETSYHATFSEALSTALASPGSTLKIYTNLTTSYNTTINRNMTLDLNGYTLSGSSSGTSSSYRRLLYVNNVTLTVNDSRGGGKISYTGSGNTYYGTIWLNSSQTKVTVNGGTIECNKTAGSTASNAASAIRSGGTTGQVITINGGELIANSNTSAYTIYDYQVTTNVNGGKLKANGSSTVKIFNNGSSTTVSGGYFSSDNLSSATIATGCEKWDVEDSEPEKAQGYNYKIVKPHTIQFENCDGRLLQSKKWIHGEIPMYGGVSYVDDANIYVFRAWKASTNSQEYTDPLPAATQKETYTAQYNVIPKEQVENNYVIEEDATGTIETNTEKNATTVRVSGTLNIPTAETTLTTNDLIIESTTDNSGQVTGTGTLNVTGNAYFDVKFNGDEGTADRTWYAVAVPWEVNSETGIWSKEGNRPLIMGRDFDLVWYDGAERAAHGDSYACWRYLVHETDKKMHPGKMYMMYFRPGFKTVRFIKTPNAPINYMADEDAITKVETYTLGTGNQKDANWNGIANPSLCYATLATDGVMYGQVLNNGNVDDYLSHSTEVQPVYSTVILGEQNLVVGKPIAVQATTNNASIVVTNNSGAYSAPKYGKVATNMQEGIDVVYAVHFAAEGKTVKDNLFVQATEDMKDDRYVVGQDLAKGGIAKRCPQLWVERYDAKLSVNTQMLENDIAKYPLTLNAPKTGEYVISTDSSDDKYDLYLTFNGHIIWNLSNGSYSTELQEGNISGYGLCISVKGLHGTEGMDEAVVDAQGETRKVIIDDKIYIIRGNRVYSAEGQLVH